MQDTDASVWPLARELVPAMKAQADRGVRADVVSDAGEEGPVPLMDVSTLAAHLGLTPAEILAVVASSAVVETASAPPAATATPAPLARHPSAADHASQCNGVSLHLPAAPWYSSSQR
jgi:hypothetical protein